MGLSFPIFFPQDFTPIIDEVRAVSGGAEKFHNFLKKELIPYVEENYRASDYKILMGHSLGGTFAAFSLLEHPDVFDAYIAVSPFLQYADNYIIGQAELKLKKEYDKANSFYMTLGEEPGYLEVLDKDSVIFTGYLTHHELRYLFPCCDVAIFPSVVAEAGPLVFLEALASGCFPLGTYFAGMAASIDSVAHVLENEDVEVMKINHDEKDSVKNIAENVIKAFLGGFCFPLPSYMSEILKSKMKIMQAHVDFISRNRLFG